MSEQQGKATVQRLVELGCRGRFQIEVSVVQLIPCPKCPPGPALCDIHCMKDRVQVSDETAGVEGERIVMDLQVEAGVLSHLVAGERYLLTVDSLNGYAGTLVRVDARR